MNDDFLTQFRKDPRHGFAEELYQRINTPMDTSRPLQFRRYTLAVAICLALIAALAFSPGARAAFNSLIRQIGGITYIGEDETTGQPPLDESQVTLVPEEFLPLEQARTRVPFEIHLPEWTPEGYTMSSMVRISYFPDRSPDGTNPFVYITWMKSQEIGGPVPIELVVAENGQWLIDLDHLQEVQINGEPAGLTGGSWNADTAEWDASEHDLMLAWRWHGIMYMLRSPGATVEELIQMAESIP